MSAVATLQSPAQSQLDSSSAIRHPRIPSLDGWRGVAIALVLFDHTQAALLRRYWKPWMQTGQHGVTIFFVLSGFLITSKLLEAPIDLKRFYVRRFFRLMPVAWAYLAALLIYGTLSNIHVLSGRELLSCLFFYRNFLGEDRSIFAGHFWSLSMEEQFYLFWPCLLALAGLRRARWVAGVCAIACAAYRFTHWAHYDRQWLSFQTQVRADAILIGCLLATLLSDSKYRAIAARWSRFWTAPALAVLIFSIAYFHWLPPLYECIAIALLIASSVLRPHSMLARPLSASGIVWLGTISYSVYVWQQYFLTYRGIAQTLPLLCLMPAFALASYYLIERPATRYGHRISRRMRD